MKIVKVGDNRQNKPQEENITQGPQRDPSPTGNPRKGSSAKIFLLGGGAVIFLLIIGAILYATVFNKENSEGNDTLEGIANMFSGNSEVSNETQNVIIETITAEPVNDSKNHYTFEGTYPKITGLNKIEFEKTVNKIFIDNINDYKRSTSEYGEVNAYSSFEIFTKNSSTLSIVQNVGWSAYQANGYGSSVYTVNLDIKNFKILSNNDLGVDRLPDGLVYSRLEQFASRECGTLSEETYTLKYKSTLIQENFAIRNDSLIFIFPGMLCIYRASTGIYHIPIKKFGSNDNSITSSGETNTGSSGASEPSAQVSKWISALGNRDFSTAYDLMSPSMRGNYSHFTSRNAYGGITNTKVYSVETVNSSGCSYEVIAIYDSYDPSNRDGKYTQRFSINNCNGNWVITKIKNISVDYYR